jgi:hypothetical protein
MADKSTNEITVTKSAECHSVSGRSFLSYEVGTDQAGSTWVRVVKNTGKGFFKPNWIELSAVHKLLEGSDSFTRAKLLPLFIGTSINGAGFLMAVLRAEGLIELSNGARHAYRYIGLKGVNSTGAMPQEAKSLSTQPKPTKTLQLKKST